MPKKMNSQQLRLAFTKYFRSLDHTMVASSSLIPANDPTLLFTNAGMVQFKDLFLGLEQRPYSRAVSVQRCMRAGGKHNDLENVGYTARHHTFFEMLGNFSFGDYFKHEAIQFAWNFLTQVLELPPERLWVTVYRDDKESEDIWLKKIKVDDRRFVRCGEKDNFWQMGDTGPCGPCTEIFYDHGPTVPGGPPGSRDQEGDRYVELWNIVFTQYNRDIDGKLKPLPQRCVDTGMGLERVAAVMQGVHDNYAIESFKHLLTALSHLIQYEDTSATSMRVIVDHIRATAFLIADGVTPSNEGRGYVLRRIIRRAVRYGYRLGQQEPFFYRLAPALVHEMGQAYPELVKRQPLIERVIQQEEAQFFNTLEKGLKILDEEMAQLQQNKIPGNIIFQLYDTYGFPPDLTADIAKERNLKMDYAGFNAAMARQRKQSLQAQQFNIAQVQKVHVGGETEFIGYDNLTADATVKKVMLQNYQPASVLKTGEKGIVVLDRTPFYAESGGQIGDTGYLYFASGSFRVKDTKKQGMVHLHYGEMVKGQLHTKETVRAEVDATREAITLNHSATHLLHEALRRVLGDHVTQKGSLVEARRLRFDFSHPHALTHRELQAIERLINQQIRANLPIKVTTMTPDEAKEMGALALFGERYGKQVRVLSMGDFSTEICGGTHVTRTGSIGLCKIVAELACASGVRRIEAVTGKAALSHVEAIEERLQEISQLLKTNTGNVVNKLTQLLREQHVLTKKVAQFKQQLAQQQAASLMDEAVDVAGVKVLAIQLPALDPDTLRTTLDQLKQGLRVAAAVLATVKDDKVHLIAGVTKNCSTRINAVDLLNLVAQQVGGKGGGRADLAQGGGDKPQALTAALNSVVPWVEKALQ